MVNKEQINSVATFCIKCRCSFQFECMQKTNAIVVIFKPDYVGILSKWIQKGDLKNEVELNAFDSIEFLELRVEDKSRMILRPHSPINN